jgi:hypothetical protein
MLSALCTLTKPPYKTDLLWETRRALNRPGRARTEVCRVQVSHQYQAAYSSFQATCRTQGRVSAAG